MKSMNIKWAESVARMQKTSNAMGINFCLKKLNIF